MIGLKQSSFYVRFPFVVLVLALAFATFHNAPFGARLWALRTQRDYAAVALHAAPPGPVGALGA